MTIKFAAEFKKNDKFDIHIHRGLKYSPLNVIKFQTFYVHVMIWFQVVLPPKNIRKCGIQTYYANFFIDIEQNVMQLNIDV